MVPSFPTEILTGSTILSERLSAIFPVELDKLQSKKEKCATWARPGDHPSALAYPRLFSCARTFFRTSGSCNKIHNFFLLIFMCTCILQILNSKTYSRIHHKSIFNSKKEDSNSNAKRKFADVVDNPSTKSEKYSCSHKS